MRVLLRLLVLPGAIACVASAQIQPHFGIAAGVPLTDTLLSSESSSTSPGNSFFDRYNSKTKRLLIGPAFRLDLISGLGLEFDALYQRVDFDVTTGSTTPPSFSNYSFQQTTANRWQFPLLVQYGHALLGSKTRLFLEFGPAISHIGGSQSTVHQTATNPVVTNPATGATTSTTTSNVSSFSGSDGTQAGVVLGAGVDVTMFHLHVRPRFRYSHWFSANGTSQTLQTLYPTALLSGSFLVAPVSPVPVGAQFNTRSNEASILLDVLF